MLWGLTNCKTGVNIFLYFKYWERITHPDLTVRLQVLFVHGSRGGFRRVVVNFLEEIVKVFSKKKSIAIVGFSSKSLVGLATNRDALLKIGPSIN
jgi:hypothetical protein